MNNNPYRELAMDGFRDAEIDRKAYEAEYHGRVRIPRKGFASPEQMAISVGDEVTDNVRKGIVTAVSDDLVTVNVGGGHELCYWRSDLYSAKASGAASAGNAGSTGGKNK